MKARPKSEAVKAAVKAVQGAFDAEEARSKTEGAASL
jgi:hypothetical protein